MAQCSNERGSIVNERGRAVGERRLNKDMDGDQDNVGNEDTVNVSKLVRANLQLVVACNIYTKAA